MTFKIGDKVKVVKSARDCEFHEDSFFCFIEEMDDFIGDEFTISTKEIDCVTGDETDWYWPEQSLELVENSFSQKTYSVQQVLRATEDLFDSGMMIHAQEIEKYLVKQQDPEWKEYQRLKEKFED